jgi:hypothetical protein
MESHIALIFLCCYNKNRDWVINKARKFIFLQFWRLGTLDQDIIICESAVAASAASSDDGQVEENELALTAARRALFLWCNHFLKA